MKKIVLVLLTCLLLTACAPTSIESDGGVLPEAIEEPNPIDCLVVENIGNVIDKEVPAFSGSSIYNLWVYPRFRYSNYCTQDVVGLKGEVSFQNVLGDEIFSGGWTEDFTIAVGKSVKSDPSYGFEYTQFDDEHGQLMGLDAKKTAAIFKLETLVFEDGTKLTR